MRRYIIIGAGAVGASLAAQFELSGTKYALVGRGTQINHLKTHGLSYQRPLGERQIALNVFDTGMPPELALEDILLLTVKSQDVASALAFWSWRSVSGTDDTAAERLPLVTFQNGLAAEKIALRTFSKVYGASILTPARYTETGKVAVAGDPQPGVITLGLFPNGSDKTAEQIVADLNRADYLAERSDDIRRWKSAKLLHNVRNALELFDGADDLRAVITQALVNETNLVLKAAGYDIASSSERTQDISGWGVAQNSGVHPGQQSTWQSFTRGTSSEVDYLNGEIVLLGRLASIPTPYNQAVQTLAGKLEHQGGFTNAVRLGAIQAYVEKYRSRLADMDR